MEFSSNLSGICTKWCAQTFPQIFFGLFAIFDSNFAKIVAPSINENQNYVVHLTEQSHLKTALKTASKSTYKPSHNTCLNYEPRYAPAQACNGSTKRQT